MAHSHAPARGLATAGMIYFLTAVNRPSHKESIRNHPWEFSAGVLLHLGALAALAHLLVVTLRPAAAGALSFAVPLLATSLPAGLALLTRRLRSRDLRAMSTPDDYLAILATCALVAATLAAGLRPAWTPAALLVQAAVLTYLPLGKLRHALFFFLARAEFGRRLGHRGVLPPA